MRGDFDVNKNLYPVTVAFRGRDQVVITNLLTDEVHRTETLVGEYNSPERTAQWKKLESEALELNKAIRSSSEGLPDGVTTAATAGTEPVLATTPEQLGLGIPASEVVALEHTEG